MITLKTSFRIFAIVTGASGSVLIVALGTAIYCFVDNRLFMWVLAFMLVVAAISLASIVLDIWNSGECFGEGDHSDGE